MRLVLSRNTFPAMALLPALLASGNALGAATDDDFYGWYGISAAGSLGKITPALEPFRWSFLNQARLGSDSSDLTENLLFFQLGYALTDDMLFSLGYTHDWLSPLGGKAFEENRSYEEFQRSDDIGLSRLTSRARLEQRYRDPGGDTGWRAREMIQLAWPVPQIPHLSLVGSEEAFFYLNTSVWGDSGFTENRAYLGLSYAFTSYFTGSLGYLHQYIVHDNQDDSSNHSLSVNLGFNF